MKVRVTFVVLWLSIVTIGFAYSKPKHKHCTKLLGEFSHAYNMYSICLLTNSTNEFLCRSCVYNYLNTTKLYDSFLAGSDGQTNKSCRETFLNANRLNVIEETYSFVTTTWDQTYCKDCFDWTDNITTIKTSNRTNKFIFYYKELQSCINETEAVNVCVNCIDRYQQLNDYFDSIKQSQENKICFDVEDSMNKTRISWSVDFKCCKDKKTSQQTFFILFSTVLTLFIGFYSSMIVYTKREERSQFNPLNDVPTASQSQHRVMASNLDNPQAQEVIDSDTDNEIDATDHTTVKENNIDPGAEEPTQILLDL